ncbi:MAG TPA: Gfo/Idh/MocA family oxidoreductase, partial [Longimicrobiales bacterium]|nr:Gfo/Idh/MocA family oxidoreductase [Longimicrobiales bacterium]
GVLHFPGGVTAHFDCALTMERCEFYEAAGTGGVLRVESAFLPGTGEVEVLREGGPGGRQVHPVAGDDEYRLMVEHFADCALHGRVPRYTAREAAANMRVINALYRSARGGGSPVEVEG